MSVFTKVLFAGSALALLAGWLVGWVIPLVDGRTAHFAVQRGSGSVASRHEYGQAWLAQGQAWMTTAYVLLAVGGLLLVLAVVALVLNLREQNRKLKAAAKAA